MKHLNRLTLLGMSLACAATAAQAEYPERAVTVIVPWSAGGGSDATARIVAQLLEEELGQPFNVVNRTGGGSIIGHTAAAQAEPDGYTLANITTELSMFHWLGQSDISYEDYLPVALFNADYGGIFVSADSDYETLDQLAAAVSENSTAVAGGGANVGGVNHLAWADFVSKSQGGEAFWVPSEGAAPALQLLTSGTIDAVVIQFPEARALMDAGEVRALATLGTERNDAYPDVPTVEEAAGFDVSISGWRGLAAPLGTPDEVISVLDEAMGKVTSSAEFEEFMEMRQFGISYLPSGEFEKYLAQRDVQFGEAMKSAGLID